MNFDSNSKDRYPTRKNDFESSDTAEPVDGALEVQDGKQEVQGVQEAISRLDGSQEPRYGKKPYEMSLEEVSQVLEVVADVPDGQSFHDYFGNASHESYTILREQGLVEHETRRGLTPLGKRFAHDVEAVNSRIDPEFRSVATYLSGENGSRLEMFMDVAEGYGLDGLVKEHDVAPSHAKLFLDGLGSHGLLDGEGSLQPDGNEVYSLIDNYRSRQ